MQKVPLATWVQLAALALTVGAYLANFFSSQAQIKSNTRSVEIVQQDMRELRAEQARTNAAVAGLQGTVSATLMRRP